MQATVALLTACLTALPASQAEADAAKDQRRPRQFMILFSFGYGGDDLLPNDRATFEELAKKVQAANYTAVMGTYEDWKVEICRRHGLKFVVNLLTDEHHVYKNAEGAKALCERLRGDETVWGYHLFSDMNYKTAGGRNRDVDNVHRWDPTHPTFVGSYKLSGNNRLTDPDVHAYYDFHWQRGPEMNFPHLLAAWKISREKDACFYRWMRVSSGLPGKGNPNRCLYTVNTSIACGLKGVFWFIGQEMMDRDTWDWNQYGRDIARVNARIRPLGPELMKLGNPLAVYSTETTKTLKDREKAETDPPIPPPLQGVPADHWFRVDSGEVVIGTFKDDQGRDAVFLANHNAYAPQSVVLRLEGPVESVSLFDRKSDRWEMLEVVAGRVRFHLEPAGGELLRVTRPIGAK